MTFIIVLFLFLLKIINNYCINHIRIIRKQNDYPGHSAGNNSQSFTERYRMHVMFQQCCAHTGQDTAQVTDTTFDSFQIVHGTVYQYHIRSVTHTVPLKTPATLMNARIIHKVLHTLCGMVAQACRDNTLTVFIFQLLLHHLTTSKHGWEKSPLGTRTRRVAYETSAYISAVVLTRHTHSGQQPRS